MVRPDMEFKFYLKSNEKPLKGFKGKRGAMIIYV